MHGDTAWSLIAQLSREDALRYLEDRRARGFNTLLVNLLERKYAAHAPANANGDAPFLNRDDFATPNEAYFAHADWVLQQAAQDGFLVLLVPAYVGFGGTGDDGWYPTMVANGSAKLRTYGEYLGKRFAGFANIVWTHGGDFNPPEKNLLSAVMEGIQAYDRRALHSAHTGPETAAAEYWPDAPWLRVNNIYTYQPVYYAAYREYVRRPARPFFLIESVYENEHGAGAHRARVQAYQALLSGAAGQVFGNHPIWHFDAPGMPPAPTDWHSALDSAGTQSMTHLRALFEQVGWPQLVPDFDGALVVSGAKRGMQHASAAMDADRKQAVIYLPETRYITVDMARFAGPRVIPRWYNPAKGYYVDAEAGGNSLGARGLRRFRPPLDAGNVDGDWVLILQSAS
jgi:hypothetical protein